MHQQLAAVSVRFIGDAVAAVFWVGLVVGREKMCINKWCLMGKAGNLLNCLLVELRVGSASAWHSTFL